MACIRLFFYGLLAFLLSGCSQTVTETLYVPPTAPVSNICTKKVVVLPFADYFYADDVRSGHIRNTIVMEYMVDRLTSRGVTVPVQEDVLQYLEDENIISMLPVGTEARHRDNKSLENEINDQDWSGVMRDELRRFYTMEKEQSAAASIEEYENLMDMPGMYALNPEKVQDIGTRFEADYLVRGRIIEYYYGNKPNPLMKGAKSSEAVVHLRVWVQDTANGDVVWTNRDEVHAGTDNLFVAGNPSALFQTALGKAATTLIDDFMSKIEL